PRTDTCVCGMVSSILEAFDFDAPSRREGLVAFLLERQLRDGGWNCRTTSKVSSLHTTLSVLEALHLRHTRHPDGRLTEAMGRAHEYLFERRLFRSKRTGEVIKTAFTRFAFPPTWRYDVLRALDHLQQCGAPRDPRLEEPIVLLLDK